MQTRCEPLALQQLVSASASPLLLPPSRPGFAFVGKNGMQHDFVWIVWRIMCVSFTPVIAYSVSKNVSIAVERR